MKNLKETQTELIDELISLDSKETLIRIRKNLTHDIPMELLHEDEYLICERINNYLGN